MNALAHRAMVAAIVHGVLEKKPNDVSMASCVLGGSAKADLVHLTDDPAIDGGFERLEGAVAMVVSSPTAAALVASASASAAASASVWASASAWASTRTSASAGPPLSHARLHSLASGAASAGFSLVVPEIALASFPRTPIARAVLHVFARGALAFPLLFVPSARSPKQGLPKTKLDRISEMWVASESAASSSSPLVAAALDVLADRNDPLPFKELLRDARDRRGSASTADAKELASALYRLWSDAAIALFAIDPQRQAPPSS